MTVLMFYILKFLHTIKRMFCKRYIKFVLFWMCSIFSFLFPITSQPVNKNSSIAKGFLIEGSLIVSLYYCRVLREIIFTEVCTAWIYADLRKLIYFLNLLLFFLNYIYFSCCKTMLTLTVWLNLFSHVIICSFKWIYCSVSDLLGASSMWHSC